MAAYGAAGMEENKSMQSTAQAVEKRDTKRFDRFLLAYFLGIIFISFYALLSQH